MLSIADRFGFWFYALPPDVKALTLPEMHGMVAELWLKRHNEAILGEESARRKGRPPSKREIELKALKIQDEQEYWTGIGDQCSLGPFMLFSVIKGHSTDFFVQSFLISRMNAQSNYFEIGMEILRIFIFYASLGSLARTLHTRLSFATVSRSGKQPLH